MLVTTMIATVHVANGSCVNIFRDA